MGGVRAEVGVCGKEKGKADAAGCGAAGLGGLRPGTASFPALPAEDGSDEGSRGGHFLLGWMRRSPRRRGGDRTEDWPCRGAVSPGLAAGPLRASPQNLGGTASLGRGRSAGHVTTQPGLTQR